MKNKLISLGADVECFVTKMGSDEIIPLTPTMIPGTKDKPFEISSHASIQLDNVLAEVTYPPASSSGVFASNSNRAIQHLEYYLNDQELTPVFKSHHHFKKRELRTPWGRAFGCAPDFAANSKDENKPFSPMEAATLRCASGHIHCGLKRQASASEIIQYVRALDFVIGAPLAILHNDPERRKLYGQAGRFRFKPYGFEYRTPDNWWFGTKQNRSLIAEHIYVKIQQVVSCEVSHRNQWVDINKYHSRLAAAINQGNVQDMKSLLQVSPFTVLPWEKISGETTVKRLDKGDRLMNPYYTTSAGPFATNDPSPTWDE